MITQLAAQKFLKDPNVRTYIAKLAANIKTIEKVRLTMADVPFSPFFLSEDLTNAFLDYKFELAWNFELDMVLILNLDDVRLIDTLVVGSEAIFIGGWFCKSKGLSKCSSHGWSLTKNGKFKAFDASRRIANFRKTTSSFPDFRCRRKSVSDKKKSEIFLHINNEEIICGLVSIQ